MEFPENCPIKGTPMEPVTTREWELLVKAIDELKEMVGEKLDKLHLDLSGQRIKQAVFEDQLKSITSEVMNIKDGRRWRWEHVVLPLLIGLILYMVPHFTWKP